MSVSKPQQHGCLFGRLFMHLARTKTHYSDVTWVVRYRKSPATRLFVQQQPNIKENIKGRGIQWIPITKGQYALNRFHLVTSSFVLKTHHLGIPFPVHKDLDYSLHCRSAPSGCTDDPRVRPGTHCADNALKKRFCRSVLKRNMTVCFDYFFIDHLCWCVRSIEIKNRGGFFLYNLCAG